MTCPFSSNVDAQGRVHLVSCTASCILFDEPNDACMLRSLITSIASVVKNLEETRTARPSENTSLQKR